MLPVCFGFGRSDSCRSLPNLRLREWRETPAIADIAIVVQTLVMVLVSALPLIGLLSSASAAPSMQDREITYGAAVTFSEGECWFWTGDVGLTTLEFQSDLESRFDRRGAIVISHVANTPTRCVKMARRSAARAGFKVIATEVRADAGPIGPPMNGS